MFSNRLFKWPNIIKERKGKESKNMRVMSDNEIYVCQSGTCRRKGSDATLVEIEELGHLVGGCTVEKTGCLGYCSQGPAVAIIPKINKRSKQQPRTKYHVKVNTIQKSAAVIKDATGRDPPTSMDHLPPPTRARFSEIRATKKREYFLSTYQWNKALSDITESSSIHQQAPNLNHSSTIIDILKKAGYSPNYLPHLLKQSSSSLFLEMPSSIDSYASWNLHSVEVVSRHSAIFHFTTKDIF